MNPSPIFFHSLYCSGTADLAQSVYAADPSSSRLYAKPLSEIYYMAQDDPGFFEALLSGAAFDLGIWEPGLSQDQVATMHAALPRWTGLASEKISYHSLFDSTDQSGTERFLGELDGSSSQRSIFDLTRTVWRLDAVSKACPGTHIYVRRNARDTWWAQKKSGQYYEAFTAVVATLANSPSVLAEVTRSTEIRSNISDNISTRLERAYATPTLPEDSYRIFYALWLLADETSATAADLVIDIDLLSNREPYRRKVATWLQGIGAGEIDFSDVKITQGIYSREECDWFEQIEHDVWTIFCTHARDAGQKKTPEKPVLIRNHSSQIRSQAAQMLAQDAQALRWSQLASQRDAYNAMDRLHDDWDTDIANTSSEKITQSNSHTIADGAGSFTDGMSELIAIKDKLLDERSQKIENLSKQLEASKSSYLALSEKALRTERRLEKKVQHLHLQQEETEKNATPVVDPAPVSVDSELESKNAELVRCLEAAHQRMHSFEQDIQQLRESTSWKATAPLRKVANRFRRPSAFSIRALARPVASGLLVIVRHTPGANWLVSVMLRPSKRLSDKYKHFASVRGFNAGPGHRSASPPRNDRNLEGAPIKRLPESTRAILQHTVNTLGRDL